MATKRYDSQCEDLARYFLAYPQDESEVVELSGVIQEAIEEWDRNRPAGGTLAQIFKKKERVTDESDYDDKPKH
jgi:hypothetical protein